MSQHDYPRSKMSPTTPPAGSSSTPEAASPLRKRIGAVSPLSQAELDRRTQGAQRLKERLSRVPFYAKQAKGDPDYWQKFYASRVKS